MVDFSTLWVGYGWSGVALLAVLISFLFAALGYALGAAFRLQNVSVWAREELFQTLASALIVAYALIFVALLSEFSCILASQTNCSIGNDHMTIAKGIVDNLITQITTQVNYIFLLNMRASFAQHLIKYWDFGYGPFGEVFTGDRAVGFMIGPYAGASIITETIDYIFGVLIPILSSVIAQSFILTLIDSSLFPVLLAMGIILRTFFFSRKIGGLLMAIAIGIFTIYPLMYILLQPFFVLTPYDFNVPLSAVDYPAATYCPPRVITGNGHTISVPSTQPFCISALGVLQFYFGIPNMFVVGNAFNPTYMFYNGAESTQKTVYAGMQTPYDGVLPTVGYLLIPGLFFPMLDILVTISFIKVLSPTLGGDVTIAGLTRII